MGAADWLSEVKAEIGLRSLRMQRVVGKLDTALVKKLENGFEKLKPVGSIDVRGVSGQCRRPAGRVGERLSRVREVGDGNRVAGGPRRPHVDGVQQLIDGSANPRRHLGNASRCKGSRRGRTETRVRWQVQADH